MSLTTQQQSKGKSFMYESSFMPPFACFTADRICIIDWSLPPFLSNTTKMYKYFFSLASRIQRRTLSLLKRPSDNTITKGQLTAADEFYISSSLLASLTKLAIAVSAEVFQQYLKSKAETIWAALSALQLSSNDCISYSLSLILATATFPTSSLFSASPKATDASREKKPKLLSFIERESSIAISILQSRFEGKVLRSQILSLRQLLAINEMTFFILRRFPVLKSP